MEKEETLVFIKPHAVRAGWEEDILNRYKAFGFVVSGRFFCQLPRTVAAKLYAKHEGNSCFPGLIDAMCEGDALAVTLVAPDAIRRVHELNGATNPDEALPGTIRHDFKGPGGPRNTVHASDSALDAAREIDLIFREKV